MKAISNTAVNLMKGKNFYFLISDRNARKNSKITINVAYKKKRLTIIF